MLKRLLEIKRRKAELRAALNILEGDELDKAIKEAEDLESEEKGIQERMHKAEQAETGNI